MKNFICNKAQKLSDFLLSSYGGSISYSTIMKLLRKKDVKINGLRVNKDVGLSVGDEVCCYYDGKLPELNVVYKDDNIVILDKPCKITSEDFEVIVKQTYVTAELCHRLDTNTDGLLCFSLNEMAKTQLFNAFKNRTIKKYYLAEVYGEFTQKSGTFTDYLVKDADSGSVKIFSKQQKNSVKIITLYKTLKQSGGTSLIEVELVTGKTHQIRAHLAYHGHFIIGDGKYGDNKINKLYKANSQRLTAYKIMFSFDGELSYLNGKEITLNREVYGVKV